MRVHSLSSSIIAICGLLANASAAGAAPETWVSPTGTDSGNNSCSITAPCRTFSRAHLITDSGGTINVLSSGNFGRVEIGKSISIVADGAEAVISTGPFSGIDIFGSPIIVSLRGLTIDAKGIDGISFHPRVSGSVLHVQKCVIRSTINGIVFSGSGASELYVSDTIIADTSQNGILIQPTTGGTLAGGGSAKVVLDRVRVQNAASKGIAFVGTATPGSISATVRDSVSAGNASHGILAEDGGGGTTIVMVDGTASVKNNTGIRAAGTGATIRMGDSTVAGNVLGLVKVSGGVIDSYGTNKVHGNSSDGSPSSTINMK